MVVVVVRGGGDRSFLQGVDELECGPSPPPSRAVPVQTWGLDQRVVLVPVPLTRLLLFISSTSDIFALRRSLCRCDQLR